MSNNNITNIKPMCSLLKLTNLDISDNRVNTIKELKNMKSIKELNICNNNISDLEG